VDEIGETLWGFIALTVAILLIAGLGVAILFLGTSVLLAGIPITIGYWWYHREYLSSEAQEKRARQRTYALYEEVKSRCMAVDVAELFLDRITVDDEHNHDVLFRMASRLVGFEGLGDYPPKPPPLCNSIEGGRYRDFLTTVSPESYHERLEHIVQLANLAAAPPTNANVATIVLHAVSYGHETRHLPKTTTQLDANYLELNSVPPQNYQGDDIIWDYFKGTPLTMMREVYHDDSVSIPDHLRTQHHMILGGTGHGKTQCLQEMILKDIEDEDACSIVIDSQEGMLERLLHVVPSERVMYLDGGNISYPLALSAFSIGSTTRPEDEPRVRMATALYEHMFASRETKFTTKQQTLYRFLSRFLFAIPNANFATALDILENGYEPYDEHVARLAETEQSFIRGNLDSPKAKGASQGYRHTRQEVAQRLYTLLESATIRSMFNAPANKVDLPAAIKDNRIILINTAQQTLGLEGATLFGRYCIAQIAMEVLARPETSKRVYFYIDEAQEYLSGDPIIHRLFEQGRKRGLCMICAFHRLGQVGDDLTDMMRSLTSIKFAGGISDSDASKLAKEMKTDATTITDQPELSFWAWFKGHTPGVYRVSPMMLENLIKEKPADTDSLKAKMLREYHYDPQAPAEDEDEPAEFATDDEEEDFDNYYSDDWEPSPSPDKPEHNPRNHVGDIDPDRPQNLD